MITKNELKYYSSLLQKKYRVKERKFLVEGRKLIPEAIDAGFFAEKVFYTFAFSEEDEKFIRDLRKNSIECIQLKAPEFERLCDTSSPQGILAVFKNPSKNYTLAKLPPKCVALENISDPGNLGAILRICDWFGFSDVILNQNCAEIFNPKTIRGSAGSVFRLKIHFPGEFYEALSEIKTKGYKLINTDTGGENVLDFNFPRKAVLVFSNEGHGPSNEVNAISDITVGIPGTGKTESLNVSVAAGIILSRLFNSGL